MVNNDNPTALPGTLSGDVPPGLPDPGTWTREDREAAALEFLEALHEPESAAPYAVQITHKPAGRAGGLRTREFTDLAAAAAFAVARSLAGDEVWHRVGRTAPGTLARLEPGKRGGKEATTELTALVIDLDVAGPAHKTDDLPDLGTALAFLDSLPVPLMTVWSGNGLHAYARLMEPLERGDDMTQALAAWKSWTLALGARAGATPDPGPADNPAGLLRVPGTTNWKHDPRPVVVLGAIPGPVYLEDIPLPATLPAAPVATTGAAPTTAPARVTLPAGTEPLTLDLSGHWASPPPTARHADLVTRWIGEDAAALATAAPGTGNAAARDLGWRLRRWVDGEVLTVAGAEHVAREALAIRGGDAQEHIDVVRYQCTAATINAAARGWDSIRPDTPANHTTPSPADTATGDDQLPVPLIPLAVALETGQATTSPRVHVPGVGVAWAEHAPGDPQTHGTWLAAMKLRTFPDGEGGTYRERVEVTTRVAEYYVRQAAERIEPGNHIDGDTIRVRCDVVTAAGTWTSPWLTPVEAAQAGTVITKSRARVALPGGREARETLAGLLPVLWADEIERHRPIPATGWTTLDGRAAFVGVGPLGTVTADGITTSPDMTAEPLTDARTGRPLERACMQRVGHDALHGDMSGMVRAWRAVAPDRVTLTVLGLELAARARLTTRGGAILHGKTGTGKTALAGVVKTWSVAAPAETKSWHYDLPRDSEASCLDRAGRVRDSLNIADDLRELGEHRAISPADTAASLAQVAQGGEGGTRSDGVGGTRAATAGRFTLLVTAEHLPTRGEGILNRLLHLPVEHDHRARGLTINLPALRAYTDEWADTGLARACMASLTRWLAARADALGGVEAMTAEHDRLWALHRRALEARTSTAPGTDRAGDEEGGARTIDMAASVLTGLAILRDYMTEHGQGAAAPTETDALEAMVSVVRTTWRGTRTQDPAALVIGWVRDQLDAGQGALEGADGRPVQGIDPNDPLPRACGWTVDGRPVPLGRLGRDGHHVLIYPAAWERARMAVPELRGMNGAQIREAVRAVGVVSLQGPEGGLVASSVARGKRGAVLTADALGLPPLDPAARAAAADRDDRDAAALADGGPLSDDEEARLDALAAELF